MKLSTLALLLVGNRRAILEAAADRRSLAIGALFVVSASLARNYDREDLLHEPWHLGAGFLASAGVSLLLFAVVYLPAKGRTALPPFWQAYLSFLGVFWLMAPMGWLYGIPYERLLPYEEAINANAWTLAFVAVWRVALAARVLSVIFGVSWLRLIWVVMLCGDAVTITLLSVAPLPTIDLMGGFQGTAEERLVAEIACVARFWAILSAPLWLIAAPIAVSQRSFRPTWRPPPSDPTSGIPKGCIAAAAGAILAWTAAAAVTQPEQLRRAHAERLIRGDRLADALRDMSRFRRDQYPPAWDPPPRIGYHESTPDLDTLVRTLITERPAAWVDAIFLGKVERLTRGELWFYPHYLSGEEDLRLVWDNFDRAGPEELRRWRDACALLAERHPGLEDRERETLRTIAAEAERRLGEHSAPGS